MFQISQKKKSPSSSTDHVLDSLLWVAGGICHGDNSVHNGTAEQIIVCLPPRPTHFIISTTEKCTPTHSQSLGPRWTKANVLIMQHLCGVQILVSYFRPSVAVFIKTVNCDVNTGLVTHSGIISWRDHWRKPLLMGRLKTLRDAAYLMSVARQKPRWNLDPSLYIFLTPKSI